MPNTVTAQNAPTGVTKGQEPPNERHPGVSLRIEGALKDWLRGLPIRRKLKWMTMLICNLALLTASLSLFAYGLLSELGTLRSSVATLTKVIAQNTGTTLKFGYVQSAGATLNSLMANPGITSAAIYKADGAMFASMAKPGFPVPGTLSGETASAVWFGSIRQVEPIFADGKPLGKLVVHSDMSALSASARDFAICIAIVFVLVLLGARFLVLRLQSVVAEPIVHLTDVAAKVAETQDFSLRAEKLSDDEISTLADRFNAMLEEVQKRDEAISGAQIELESKVFERTSELHHQKAELHQQIRERELAEERNRENEQRYRTLFEANPVPMFVMDLETLRFVAVNLAAMRHYGYSQQQFLAMTLASITSGVSETEVMRAFRSSEKSFDAGEWRHRKKNGGIIEAQLTAHAISFNGKICKIVLATDVTERNAAQRKIEDMHRQLVETSRYAGMAEVATGVLHNVGNVLNSVNVSATILANSVRDTKAASLKKVADLLDANKDRLPEFFGPGGKGQMLLGYISTLNGQLAEEQATRISEIEQLTKNIAHIKDIVAMQQTYARVNGVMEPMQARSLVDDVLRMAASETARNRVSIQSDIPARLPDVFVDRHKVIQILINLVTNARQAMQEQPEPSRIIRIAARQDDPSIVKITVTDHGCGIPAENLAQIFNHGFTTKKNGHGFGLHSAANAAREMGGNLTAHSDGPGTGATFTLEMPIHTPDERTQQRQSP